MWLVLAAAVFALQQAHGHQAPPASSALVEVAKRAPVVRAGIGEAHDTIGTTSKEAQAQYDRGLAYLHSYWWLEAARCFNQALRLDPRLAIAHAQLSLAYTELNASAASRESLSQARALASRVSDHDR